MSVGEAGSKLGKIISFGAEVVVDHVQHDRESVLVAGIDQLLQTGRDRRRKIAARRGWRRRIPSFDFPGPSATGMISIAVMPRSRR